MRQLHGHLPCPSYAERFFDGLAAVFAFVAHMTRVDAATASCDFAQLDHFVARTIRPRNADQPGPAADCPSLHCFVDELPHFPDLVRRGMTSGSSPHVPSAGC